MSLDSRSARPIMCRAHRSRIRERCQIAFCLLCLCLDFREIGCDLFEGVGNAGKARLSGQRPSGEVRFCAPGLSQHCLGIAQKGAGHPFGFGCFLTLATRVGGVPFGLRMGSLERS